MSISGKIGLLIVSFETVHIIDHLVKFKQAWILNEKVFWIKGIQAGSMEGLVLSQKGI